MVRGCSPRGGAVRVLVGGLSRTLRKLVSVIEERLGGVSLTTGGKPILVILNIEVRGELSFEVGLIGGGCGGSVGRFHG
mgnify:CR=1 FL=1